MINNWIGEEVRSIGVESKGKLTDNWSLGATIFAANDPSGSLLALRSWSTSDIRVGLFGSLPLPNIASLHETGTFPEQASNVTPFREVDNRPGAMIFSTWRQDNVSVRFELYDNFVEQSAFEYG